MVQFSKINRAVSRLQKIFFDVGYRNDSNLSYIHEKMKKNLSVYDGRTQGYNFIYDHSDCAVRGAVEDCLVSIKALPQGIQYILSRTSIPIIIARNWNHVACEINVPKTHFEAFLRNNDGYFGLFNYDLSRAVNARPENYMIAVALDEIFDQAESVAATLLHEIGHFIDVVAGDLSDCNSFRSAHENDLISYINNVDPWIKDMFKESFAYYFPKNWADQVSWDKSRSECFAEIFAEHFEPKKPNQLSLSRIMPRMRQSIEDFINEVDMIALSHENNIPHTPLKPARRPRLR